VIHEAGKKEIPIKSEIALIQNYIDLQRFRVDAKSKISFKTEISDNSLLIAPMLFLPLIENGFKHGIKGTVNHSFININLITNKKKILFIIENNKVSNQLKEKEKASGIGLKNISERLQLLYPGKHRFEIFDMEKIFKVKLTIMF
jgi:LytS/YehU family sensor histidine kinase